MQETNRSLEQKLEASRDDIASLQRELDVFEKQARSYPDSSPELLAFCNDACPDLLDEWKRLCQEQPDKAKNYLELLAKKVVPVHG